MAVEGSVKDEILGLFRCQKSGNCCKADGVVYVTPSDINEMAKVVKMDVISFQEMYVRKKEGWLVISYHNYRSRCFLRGDNTCKVYKARPKACKTYPDWPEIWGSRERLLQETKVCPGLRMAVETYCNKKGNAKETL